MNVEELAKAINDSAAHTAELEAELAESEKQLRKSEKKVEQLQLRLLYAEKSLRDTRARGKNKTAVLFPLQERALSQAGATIQFTTHIGAKRRVTVRAFGKELGRCTYEVMGVALAEAVKQAMPLLARHEQNHAAHVELAVQDG